MKRNVYRNTLLFCLTAMLMTGCALAQKEPDRSTEPLCRKMYPEIGFESRWTRAERVWLAQHNEMVDALCPKKS